MRKKTKKDRKPKTDQPISNTTTRPLIVKRQSPDLIKAREFPIHGCWIMDGWENEGITPVVVARLQGSGRIMFGVYMVDLYCLGIKNVYTREGYSLNRFQRELPKICIDAPLPCSVELAHELIYGALEYAQKLGFEPHPDFYTLKADLMLDPADAHPRMNGVSFGKDGKPLYISGPYDSELKSKSVVSTLMRTCGPNNFDYIVVTGDPNEI